MTQKSNKLIEVLSRYAVVSDDIQDALRRLVPVKEFGKGAVLLREGNTAGECYFVLEGCIRCYYLKDGVDKTAEFYTEGDVASPVTYGSAEPSPCWLECVEPVLAAVGTPESENEMYAHNPEMEKINRVMAEAVMAKYQRTHNEYKNNTPEERYAHLVETRPDLLDRVPHYQIASYLGIAPESLSRIRKRLKAAQKGKKIERIYKVTNF